MHQNHYVHEIPNKQRITTKHRYSNKQHIIWQRDPSKVQHISLRKIKTSIQKLQPTCHEYLKNYSFRTEACTTYEQQST
jgi:hypothetical protein